MVNFWCFFSTICCYQYDNPMNPFEALINNVSLQINNKIQKVAGSLNIFARILWFVNFPLLIVLKLYVIIHGFLSLIKRNLFNFSPFGWHLILQYVHLLSS